MLVAGRALVKNYACQEGERKKGDAGKWRE